MTLDKSAHTDHNVNGWGEIIVIFELLISESQNTTFPCIPVKEKKRKKPALLTSFKFFKTIVSQLILKT